MTRPRVLVLTSTLPANPDALGPDFVLQLARRLAGDFDIEVLAPSQPGAPRSQIWHGIPVRRFRYFPRRWERLAGGSGIMENLRQHPLLFLAVPFFLAAQFIALCRLLAGGRFDLLHAHWWLPQALLAVIATRLFGRGVPVVCTLHGTDVFAFSGGLSGRLMRSVLRRCDRLCPVSEQVRIAAGIGAAGWPPVVVAPMGVDVGGLFHADGGGSAPARRHDAIVAVGRLIPVKGFDSLLAALAIARSWRPGMRLRIIGEGPERPHLEALRSRLGLDDVVELPGALAQAAVADEFRAAAVAVAPSLALSRGREGFGLVVAEAAACGCAVVVSDAHPFADILADGVSGRIVPAQDPDALAAALVQLTADPRAAQRIATAGAALLRERHGWDAASARYGEVYRDALTRLQAHGG